VGTLSLAVAAGPLITVAYRLSRRGDVPVGGFSPAQGVRGLLCFAMLASLWRVKQLWLLEHPLIRPLTVLAGYAVLTAALGPYPYQNIAFAVKLLFISLVFATAFHLSQQRLCSERWLTVCAWMVLISMMMSQIAGFTTGNTLKTYHSSHATAGLIDEAATTATYSISTVPIILNTFPDQRLSLAGIFVQLACVFFTLRRTELIAAVTALCFVVCFTLAPFRRRAPWRKTIVAVLSLAALAAVVLSSPAGEEFVTRLQDLDPSSGTGSGRYMFWRIGFDHAITRGLDAQILGDGVGAVHDVIGRAYGLAIGCHNDWLDMMNSFGLVGLAIVAWWYLGLLRFVIAMHRLGHPVFRGVLSALVMLSVQSFGSGGAFDPCFIVVYAALGFWAAQSLWSESYECAECPSY
jgi:hypothetical protein